MSRWVLGSTYMLVTSLNVVGRMFSRDVVSTMTAKRKLWSDEHALNPHLRTGLTLAKVASKHGLLISCSIFNQ